MFETTKNKLVEHFKEHLKIEKNSLIWLHTGITGLGILKGGLNLITNAFDELLSDTAKQQKQISEINQIINTLRHKNDNSFNASLAILILMGY